jgi:hypothetical protein
MKKSRFTDEQIIGFLKQAEGGMPVKELCRLGGFSDATFYIYGLPVNRDFEFGSLSLFDQSFMEGPVEAQSSKEVTDPVPATPAARQSCILGQAPKRRVEHCAMPRNVVSIPKVRRHESSALAHRG